jgi:hypothetical protein
VLAGFSIPLALLRAASSSRKREKGEEALFSPFSSRSGGAKQENAKAFDEPLFEKPATPTLHQDVLSQQTHRIFF